MKTLYTKLFIILTVSFFNFFQSKAQWSADPNVDNALNAKLISTFNFCSDGHGGAIYTWDTTDCCGHRTVYTNRIDSLGFLRWGTKGISVHHDTASLTVLPSPNICEDGKGGCYLVYITNDVKGRPAFCQHFDSNGNKLWGANGKQVTNTFSSQSYQNEPSVINDNGKGVFAVFFTAASDSANGLYAQRLNFNGAKQWGNTGKQIERAGDIRQPKAISDGNNGIAIAWTNYSFDGLGHQFQIRMNRLNHNGSVRFTFGNKKLNTIEPIGFGPFIKLMLTKQKNIIAVWLKDGSAIKLYSQKIDSIGNFLWGSSEITVCDTAGLKQFPDILTDGSEGAYYVWNDGRKSSVAYGIFAQHLNNTGVRKWQYQGVRIDSNARNYPPYFAPDVNKGMKIFWESSPSNREYMQQLNKNGAAQIAGLGTVIAAANHNPVAYKSILPASNNHDIVFLQNLSPANCYAKYVPFSGTLPLTVLNFSGVNNGEKNILSWQTVPEINTNYFSVERSDNGNNFYTIAKIKNTNTSSNYNYEDAALNNVIVYYRLKQTDADGEINYSKIVSVRQSNDAVMRITPNPAAKNCTIYFNGVENNNAVLKIFNKNGLLQKQINLIAKQSQLTFDVSSLAAGVYFCKLESADKTLTQKLIVVK